MSEPDIRDAAATGAAAAVEAVQEESHEAERVAGMEAATDDRLHVRHAHPLPSRQRFGPSRVRYERVSSDDPAHRRADT